MNRIALLLGVFAMTMGYLAICDRNAYFCGVVMICSVTLCSYGIGYVMSKPNKRERRFMQKIVKIFG